jgi:hypothetical protein
MKNRKLEIWKREWRAKDFGRNENPKLKSSKEFRQTTQLKLDYPDTLGSDLLASHPQDVYILNRSGSALSTIL